LFYNGCDSLPQQVICEKCGFILYEGTDLKPPDEIIQTHEGKCPKCDRKISFVPKKVEVKSAGKTGRRH
jgi:DNA-directed RNA polymerase subunit RPC12/RpoP